jgi:hypothetical protein
VPGCFICSNLGKNKSDNVTDNFYGFPICRFHFNYLFYKEHKAETWGNPSWKEVWDDTFKDRKEDVERAVNYMIVLRGDFRALPKYVLEKIRTHKLDKKYSSYM